ncbi:unnamed protein product [Urochloa humidicola]
MAAHPFDLNLEPPVLDLNNPIDWNGMGWEDGGEQVDGVAPEDGDENAAGQQDDVNEQDAVGPTHGTWSRM